MLSENILKKLFGRYGNHGFLIIIVLMVLISMLVHPSNYSSTSVTMNGSEYLEQAYKIYNGESPSWLWRGPMYSILLAISFFIGGVTVQSAHWMTELIFLFSVCSFYYLGKIIYGSKISFLASLLIILSFKIFAIRRDISLEFLYTGFIFLSCAIFFRAYKSNRKSFFVFSGLLLGLGILTKEISLFYLPFPILVTLLFINGRSKDVLKGVILHYLSILLILLPWVVFLYSQNETVTALLGGMRPEWSNAQSTIGYLNIITLISDLLFKGSIGTYNSLNKLFWLTPALIISTLFIFIFGFIRNNKNDKMFISVFVLFIPWTLSYGLWDDGLRHIVLSIMLFHLAFARIIFLILILINRLISHEIRLFSSKKTNLLLTLLVTSIFIIPIISFNQNSKKTFSSIIKNYKNSKYAIRFGTDITLGGRFSKEITDSAIWIKNNIPKGSVIRTGGMFHFPIKFYTNFNYQYRYIRGDITNVPKYYFLPDLISNPSSMTNSNSKQYSEFVFDAIQSLHRQEDRIVCITTTKKFRSHHFRYRKQIILILESDLKLFLEEITSKKQWIMRFDSQKVFFPLVDDILNNISNIVYNKNGVKIYETVPEKYNQYDFTRFDRLHISPWTTDDFSWLNKHYNNEYLKIDKFLSENNIHLNL